MASNTKITNMPLPDVLEDLASRFILNVPPSEANNVERICFQVEQAHWFYEDFVRPNTSVGLPAFNLRNFTTAFFHHNAFLGENGGALAGYTPQEAYELFMRYKETVPVCGAIVLNSRADRCLMVKGYKSGASWSFPRGKINQSEPQWKCAVREVLEETGLDITPYMDKLEDAEEGLHYFEVSMKAQRIRLYIVDGIPDEYEFCTKTRQEISRIAWFPISDLPLFPGATLSKKAQARADKEGRHNAKFYGVIPFVQPLQNWIRSRPTRHPGMQSNTLQSGPIHLSRPDQLNREWNVEAHDSMLPARNDESSWVNVDEGSRALQSLFFGQPTSSLATSAVAKVMSESVDPLNHSYSINGESDIESDQERGLDLATSYASSMSVASHRPGSHERFSVVPVDDHYQDLANLNSRQYNSIASHYQKHGHLAAPRPQPAPAKVEALLTLLQSPTPGPSHVVKKATTDSEKTPRHHDLNCTSPPRSSVNLLHLLGASNSCDQSPRPSSLTDDERERRRSILLQKLRNLSSPNGSSPPMLFGPPPGPSSSMDFPKQGNGMVHPSKALFSPTNFNSPADAGQAPIAAQHLLRLLTRSNVQTDQQDWTNDSDTRKESFSALSPRHNHQGEPNEHFSGRGVMGVSG